MVQALITVNAVAGSNPPNGTALVINTLIGLDNTNNGGELTYLWEFLDRPEGSAAAFSNPAIQAPTFTPDVEGSYLVKLTVNRTLATETTNTVVCAVAQLRTNARIPAAGETRETSTTRGWALAVNRFMKLVDERLSTGGMIVGEAVAPINRSGVVRVTGTYLLNAGLPDEGWIPEFDLALGSSATDTADTLYIMEYTPVGGSAAAAGDLIRVRSNGLFGPMTGGVPVVGDPVYLDNVGAPSMAAGAIPRRIGTVVGIDGADWYFHFDGTAGTGNVTNEPLVFASAPTAVYPNGVNLQSLQAAIQMNAAVDAICLRLMRFSAAQANPIFRLVTEAAASIFSISAHGDVTLNDPDGDLVRTIYSTVDLALNSDANVLLQSTGTTRWQLNGTTFALEAVGGNRPISNVLDPTGAQDASTKAYTDSKDFTTLVFGNTDLPASADHCVLDSGFGIRTAKTVASAAWPSLRVTRAGTLKRLQSRARASSTVVDTDVEVYVDSGAGFGATGIVVTHTAGATDESKQDNSNTFAVASGDRVQLRTKPAGVPGVGCLDLICSLELAPT